MAKGLASTFIKCDEVLIKITNKERVNIPEMMKLLWAYIKEHDLKIKKD